MKVEPDEDFVNHYRLTSQPFFSIIITTYNRKNILKRALDSLIRQTENDWEALIVDDESIDETSSLVLPCTRANSRFRYFKKAHSGEALSKNEGIKLTSGKFISFLDSDDEYSPGHLQHRKAILMQNPLVNFLYGGVKIIGNQYVPDRFDHTKRINLNECVIGGTFFIERSTLLRLKGFRNLMLGTDADLFERAVKANVIMKETGIPTYIYHHETEDSVTNMMLNKCSDKESVLNMINLNN
jgi:glycosyltransferase involved in cell wall biosynthesis